MLLGVQEPFRSKLQRTVRIECGFCWHVPLSSLAVCLLWQVSFRSSGSPGQSKLYRNVLTKLRRPNPLWSIFDPVHLNQSSYQTSCQIQKNIMTRSFFAIRLSDMIKNRHYILWTDLIWTWTAAMSNAAKMIIHWRKSNKHWNTSVTEKRSALQLFSGTLKIFVVLLAFQSSSCWEGYTNDLLWVHFSKNLNQSEAIQITHGLKLHQQICLHENERFAFCCLAFGPPWCAL